MASGWPAAHPDVAESGRESRTAGAMRPLGRKESHARTGALPERREHVGRAGPHPPLRPRDGRPAGNRRAVVRLAGSDRVLLCRGHARNPGGRRRPRADQAARARRGASTATRRWRSANGTRPARAAAATGFASRRATRCASRTWRWPDVYHLRMRRLRGRCRRARRSEAEAAAGTALPGSPARASSSRPPSTRRP